MKTKMKTVLSLALATVCAAGTATAFSVFAQPGASKAADNSPGSLWEQTSGFTVESNVEAPDTMKYGAIIDDGSFMWIDENSEDDYLEDWETNGVKITSTVPNKPIYFKNVLDVDALKTSDCLICISPLATVQGVADFTQIDIKLEDVDDPDNYLLIEMELNPWWAQGTRIRAGVPGVSPRAYKYCEPYSNNIDRGTELCYTSFNGTSLEALGVWPIEKVEDYRHRPFKLFYDAERKMISDSAAPQGIVYPVAIMDDPVLTGYGNEWGGFKSGRARMSVTFRSFKGIKASAMIFNVAGQGMNGESVQDTTAPSLKFEEAAKEVPMAQVGKAYPLFDYTCDDVISGAINCEISVKDPDGETVEVTDSFTPTETGYYTLSYRGQDGAGNVAEKTFKILASMALDAMNVQIDAGDVNFGVGDTIVLPKATLSGGTGILSYEVEVQRVGGETVAIKNGAFTPMLAGEYIAIYTATDYLGNQKTETVVYTVADRTKPVLMPVQQFTRLFDGLTVDIPAPVAYDYTSVVGSKLSAQVEITAKNADGSYSETIENGVFTPSKEKFGDSVTFAYTVQCNGGVGQTEEFEYTVAIQDVPTAAEEYFFYDDNVFDVHYNAGGTSMFINFQTKSGVTGAQSLSFVNPLGAEGFEIAFAVPARAKDFTALTIKLRDSANAAIGFDMAISPITGTADAYTKSYLRSGGATYTMYGTFNMLSGDEEVASTTPMRLQYLNGQIRDFNNAVVFTPTVGFNGETFEGFPSGKVYMEIEFVGITGTAGITVSKICNQTLGAMYRATDNIFGITTYEPVNFEDVIRPQIRLDKDIPDNFVFGQTVEIPYARAFDVLSPHVDVKVTLKTPQGGYIYNADVATEGMSFVLDSYGMYSLKFEARDAAGRPQSSSYTIFVKDTIDPTVVLTCAYTMELKVGGTLQVQDLEQYAVLQDNRDSEPLLTVMVITPEHEIIPLRQKLSEDDKLAKDAYTFEKAGTYRIRFYVTDDSYNTAWKDLTVVVR